MGTRVLCGSWSNYIPKPPWRFYMNIAGKTPLFRARKLENLLGVKKIYLKLEGANPYGHKYDRLAEFLIKDALLKQKEGILAEGPMAFIQSVILFGNASGMPVTVPMSRSVQNRAKLKGEYTLTDVKRSKKMNYRHFVDVFCQEHNLYNGFNGYANVNKSILAMEEIGDELYDKFGDAIDTIFLQLSYGIGLKGMYNSFERRIIKGISLQTPSLISCTIPNGNAIYEEYKKTFGTSEESGLEVISDKYSKYLKISDTELVQSSLDAVYDTRGTMLAIHEDMLIESAKQLRIKEGVHVSIPEAYSLAGLFQMAKKGQLKDGIHIVVLNDGKSHLKLEHVKKNQYTQDQLHQFVDAFLKQYSDSFEEIVDAIANALERGTIILAKRGDIVQGIAVVVHMGFQDFIPTYHLGYIGTKEGNEGRGIATELLEEVVSFTDGNVSLHVDIENKRAMRVYEKIGFKHCYNRMIYKNI